MCSFDLEPEAMLLLGVFSSFSCHRQAPAVVVLGKSGELELVGKGGRIPGPHAINDPIRIIIGLDIELQLLNTPFDLLAKVLLFLMTVDSIG